MKIKKRNEIIFHKIKVNKNNSNNRFNNSQNNFNIKDKFSLDRNSPNNSNDVYSYYQNYNYNNSPYVFIKNYKLNSSSEEKLLLNKKLNNLNNNKYQRENNYIQSKINHAKSLLNNENSEQKIINLRDINNNINMRNKRKIYRKIFNSDNLEYNKSKNLSIKTWKINDNNNIYKNKEFKTIENNNINNYINEFKLINNYYGNDNRNKNNYNILTFNDKIIYNNSLDNSCENNMRRNTIKRIYNNQRKTHQDYVIDYNNKNKNFNNNYQHFFPIRNTINDTKNYDEYSHIYNNSHKNLNKNNIISEKFQYSNVYIKRKSPYRRKEYIIADYNNKEDNYKKLFNIYRGKLTQEFLKHLKKAVNLYLLKELKDIMFFVKNNTSFKNNYIHQKRNNRSNNINFKKINSLPKIDINNYFDKEINITKGNNLNKIDNKRYTKIFYSEKKNQDEINFKKNLTSRNDLDIKPTNIYQRIKNTENNQIINKDPNKINFKNELTKINKRTNSSNIREDKNIIYKKKIKIKKNRATNVKKVENNNNPINITTQNKLSNNIIDIDINLGKPIKEISDISLLKNFENNKNRLMKFDKNKKHSKRAKTRRKYSLPKKKFLEELYEQNNNEQQNLSLSFPYKTYSYDCKEPRINKLVNKNKERLINNEKNGDNF